MSAATLLIKAASLANVGSSVGGALRSLKKMAPKAVEAGATGLHVLGDVGQAAGEALGVNPEIARAAAQVAGVGGTLYAGKAVKDQTQQKIDNLRYQLTGQPYYY